MNRSNFLIKLFSVGINLLIGLIATLVTLWQQDWFGSGDTYAFIFWAIPLAVGLAVSGETILNLFRTLPFLFRLLCIMGVSGLVSLCWLYGVAFMLGPWMGAFSFSLFYKWLVGCIAQLLFLDRFLPKPTEVLKKSKRMLGLFALPLIMVCVVAAMFAVSSIFEYLTRPEKSTFLFPQNFRGEVYIIHGQKNGEPKVYENKRRLYKIPHNGVLFTQFKAEYGRIDEEYYFVNDTNGQRISIKNENYYHPDRDSVAIFDYTSGGSGAKPTDNDSSSYHFVHFIVNTFNDPPIPSEKRLSHKQIDSIKTEYLRFSKNHKKRQ